MTEIYVSTDIETDGGMPGRNSMLSFGSAAYTVPKKLISTFSANLELLPTATPDPKTMKWWETQPVAWEACRKDLKHPAQAMKEYVEWLKSLPGKVIFVGAPTGFDFTFIYWYLQTFTNESPFGYAAIDLRSYVMGVQHCLYNKSGKRHMPSRWFDDLPHTHIALDDAIEQGALFCNILEETLKKKS